MEINKELLEKEYSHHAIQYGHKVAQRRLLDQEIDDHLANLMNVARQIKSMNMHAEVKHSDESTAHPA